MEEEINKQNIEENKIETNKQEENQTKKKKKKTPIIIIIIILLIALIAGCYYFTNKKENKKVTKQKEVKSSYKMTGNDIQDFDIKFLQLENGQKNIIYSPLSIKYALAMLKDASKGESKTQITNVIGEYKSKKYTNSANLSLANAMFVNNTIKDKLNQNYSNNLKTNYEAEVINDDFTSANNINNWVSQKTLNLVNNIIDDNSMQNLDFLLVNALAIDMNWNYKIQAKADNSDVPQKYYFVTFKHENYKDTVGMIDDYSGYEKIDFNNKKQKAVVSVIGATINNYDIVKELGEDNIKTEVEKEYREWLADPNNASYIENHLKYEKEDLRTDESIKKFMENYMKSINENYKQVHDSTDFEFLKDDNVTVFAKDLKTYDNTTLQYVGIMPNKISLEDYVKNIKAKNINEIIKNLKSIKLENFEYGKVYKIKGKIPLFKMEYNLKLKEDLQAIGIKNVFDNKKADLSNMLNNSKGAYIEKAIHKANIEFSNEGIKAGAVTLAGGSGATGAGFDKIYDVPIEEIDLTFDKPYMYIIRDKATGEIWFTGQVYEPNQE